MDPDRSRVVRPSPVDKQRLLGKLDQARAALKDSYAGLSDSRLTEPGVTGDWSVKDILAHVTTWEGEALTHLPLIIAGGRPPRYVKQCGNGESSDSANESTPELNGSRECAWCQQGRQRSSVSASRPRLSTW